MGAGWIGVDLFFVLSGFLITGILLQTKQSPVYYRSFFARRFLRIFPLYYLYIILAIAKYHASFTKFDAASLMFFYYNWQASHLGHHLPEVNSLWSLAVEEQFYILWPTIVLFFRKRVLAWLSIAGIVVALVLRLIILPHSTGFQHAYYVTPCRMDALLLGALLAIAHTDAILWRRLQRLAAPAAGVALAGLLCIALWTGHFYDYVTPNTLGGLRHSSIMVLGPGCTLLAVFFGMLLVKCTGQGAIFRGFNWFPLRRIGKYSYGMYMLHWPMMQFVTTHIIARVGHLPFDGAAILNFVLLVTFSFAGAYVSFHIFERYFLRLKRQFPATITH